MKKLSILLIGLLLVTGFAFAQEWSPSIDVSGSASVAFGVDLNNMATGFQNDASSSLSVELIAEVDLTTGGDDGLYGEITLSDVGYSEDGSPGVGGVSAKIVISPIEIIIYSAPGTGFGNVAILDVDGGDLAPALAADDGFDNGGITIVIPVDPIEVSIGVLSDGDWTENHLQDYGATVEATISVDPLTIDLGVLYGFAQQRDLGVTANVALSLADVVNGLDAEVGFDGVLAGIEGAELAWEVDAALTLSISEANADDDKANVNLGVSYSEDDDLDLEVGFTEPTGGGLVDAVGASIAVGVNDLTNDVEDMTFDIAVDIDYSANGLTPYAGFTYQSSDDLITAKAGIGLSSDVTGIDNTQVDIAWESDDLTEDGGTPAASDLGELVVTVTVSY